MSASAVIGVRSFAVAWVSEDGSRTRALLGVTLPDGRVWARWSLAGNGQTGGNYYHNLQQFERWAEMVAPEGTRAEVEWLTE